MKLGVIGTGHIGSTLARLWAAAGHDVSVGSRRPSSSMAQALAREGAVRVVTVEEAAALGDVLLTAAPYGSWPELAAVIGPAVVGKIVLDAANPYPVRDGAFAQQAIDAGEGPGVPVARLLPGAHLVRGFTSVFWRTLESEAHRAGDRVGVPLAGDDEAALAVAATLVREAGFDPVVVGPLVRAREFDPGTRVYNTGMTGPQLRAALGVG